MIRFVEHNNIDPILWDKTIFSSSFSTLFCTYSLLDVFTEGSTWHALIMGHYDYVMPLPERSKAGIHYLFSPFFVSQLGIYSSKEITAQIVSDFFCALPKKYKRVDLLLNPFNDGSFIKKHIKTLVSHQLDLTASYDKLHKNYSQNARRNLKAAQTHNLSISQDRVSLEEIVQLFCENRGKSQGVSYKTQDYKILLKAVQQLRLNQQIEIWSVHHANGTLLSGAIFLKDTHRYWFWFSGRNNQYAETRSMFLLIDAFIKAHAEENILLDFNGSMNENVARFYRGFGASSYPIGMINHSPNLFWNTAFRLYHLFLGGQ